MKEPVETCLYPHGTFLGHPRSEVAPIRPSSNFTLGVNLSNLVFDSHFKWEVFLRSNLGWVISFISRESCWFLPTEGIFGMMSFLCQLGVGWPRFHYTFADSAHGSLSSFLKTFLGRQETLVGFSFLILTHFTLTGVPQLHWAQFSF